MKHFQPDEDDLLVTLSSTLSNLELSKILGRTESSIRQRKHKLHIKNTFDYRDDIDPIDVSNPLFVYFLGLFWADGYLGKNKNCASLSLRLDDGINLDKLFDSFGVFSKKIRLKKDGREFRDFVSRNKKLISFLRSNDFESKSHLEPLKILDQIPKSFHGVFWRGFFDGDGSICRHGKNGAQISFSGNLEYEWACLIEKLGELKIKFYLQIRTTEIGGTSIIKIWRRLDCETLLNYMYGINNPLFLKRKETKAFELLNKRS